MCVVHDHKDAFFTNIITGSSSAGTRVSVPQNSGLKQITRHKVRKNRFNNFGARTSVLH